MNNQIFKKLLCIIILYMTMQDLISQSEFYGLVKNIPCKEESFTMENIVTTTHDSIDILKLDQDFMLEDELFILNHSSDSISFYTFFKVFTQKDITYGKSKGFLLVDKTRKKCFKGFNAFMSETHKLNIKSDTISITCLTNIKTLEKLEELNVNNNLSTIMKIDFQIFSNGINNCTVYSGDFNRIIIYENKGKLISQKLYNLYTPNSPKYNIKTISYLNLLKLRESLKE